MLAILLARSYDGLKLNSQAASAFYLSQMYQLSAGLNGTSTPLPFEVLTPSTFSPDPSSVRASALWSLSLVISLAGTVIATLLRQWARRYLHLTQESRGPHNRARVRELTAQGVERLQLQWMSLILPGLFHISVFLFLYGLFHYSDNKTVDLAVLLSALIYFGLYLFASIASYFPFGSICHTPLSFFTWSWSSRILWLTYKMLYNSSIKLRCVGIRTRLYLFESARAHLGRALRDPGVDMEDLARKHASFLDTSLVLRIFDSLDGHQDMEQFLSTIPGFYKSRWVKRDVPALEKLNGKRLAPAIAPFMTYSLTSGVLTEPEKRKRITICLGAINADPLLLQSTFRQFLQTLNSDIFRCIDFIHFALQRLLGDASDSDPWVKDYAQCVVAVAIHRVKPEDDTWSDIIRRYLKTQHSHYQWDGENNIRLCNLMYLARRLMDSRLRDSDQFEQGGVWRTVLTEVRKFKVMKTAPELQHEFCALWNELAFVAHGGGQASRMEQSNATHILSIIRTVYIPLHEGTDSGAVAFSLFTDDQESALRLPSSYPRCNVHRAATGKSPIRPLDPPSTSTHSGVTSTPFAEASPYRPPSPRPLPLQHPYPENSGQHPPSPGPTMQQHPSRSPPQETYPRRGSSPAQPVTSPDTQEDDE
jgi:hypothetical protein